MISFIAGFVTLLLSLSPASPADRVAGDAAGLRVAIAAARPGDGIVMKNGTWREVESPLLKRRLTPADVGPAWMKSAQTAPAVSEARQTPAAEAIHGWTILSDSLPDALAAIDAARGYGINQLQLSHELVHDLRELRDERKRAPARKLVDAAHRAGIREVVLWDHALYDLGFRLYARGPAFHTPPLLETVRQALEEIPDLARAMRDYPVKPPAGQWNWVEDADAAMRYHRQITSTGWPKEKHGVPNPYAGLTFPMK